MTHGELQVLNVYHEEADTRMISHVRVADMPSNSFKAFRRIISPSVLIIGSR